MQDKLENKISYFQFKPDDGLFTQNMSLTEVEMKGNYIHDSTRDFQVTCFMQSYQGHEQLENQNFLSKGTIYLVFLLGLFYLLSIPRLYYQSLQ